MRGASGNGTGGRPAGRALAARLPGRGGVAIALNLIAVLIMGLALAGGLAGCGGGGGGDGTDPDPCSITNVRTGTVTSWLVGVDGPVAVRWDHTGTAANVRIDLLKAGAVVAAVEASTANDGFYSWALSTGGQPDGADFGLRVTALGETGCAGEKNGLTLVDVSGCNLAWTVNVPDSITAGASWPLTWTGGATSGHVDLELWQDDLGSLPEYVGLIVADTPDDGQYQWDNVDSFEFGTNDWFVLRVSDPRVPGCEAFSEPFQLVDNVVCGTQVLGFSAGSIFNEGDALVLTFEQLNGSGLVNLRLLTGTIPVTGGLIAMNVPVDQAYHWTVNDYGSTEPDRTKFHIQVTDAANGYCVDVSDAFTIR